MSNFGFRDLRLVNAYDVAFREARSGVNAGEVLQEATCHPSLGEALTDCGWVAGATGLEAREVAAPMQRLERAGKDIRQAATQGRVALVFGSEKHGLSRGDISHCHQLVHIPTRPAHDSMNLGQAVAVCLYELVREREGEAVPDRRQLIRAPQALLDRLHAQWFSVLQETGYAKRRVAMSLDRKVRLLIRRLNLSNADATLLLGMFRQCGLALEDPRIREKSIGEWKDLSQD